MLDLNDMPQPLFADAGSMNQSAQQYFRAYPDVECFLAKTTTGARVATRTEQMR